MTATIHAAMVAAHAQLTNPSKDGKANYGAYTTLWDRLFATMRGKFEQDFIKLKDRRALGMQNPAVVQPFAETQPLSELKE